MDGSGKRFVILLSNKGLQVYDITNSGKLELDGAVLPCIIKIAMTTTKLSADGDRVIATCNDKVEIYDRNTSSSLWEHAGSIPTMAIGQ